MPLTRYTLMDMFLLQLGLLPLARNAPSLPENKKPH